MVINTNPQVWILTTYGIQRITEVMSSPTTEKLYVNNIKVGDANGEYYVPIQGVDNDLKNPIEDAEFPIISKNVDGNVVTFNAIISEKSGGYDIREIGLYERIDGVDYCFALGTCEPIVKPAYDENEDYGYAMLIDYKLHINSVNLASIYPEIILNTQTEFVNESEFLSLSRTVLFVEGNLMEQISNNTHLLGLNRAQQLIDLIESTRNMYACSTLSSLYTSLSNCVLSDQIRGFWGFNYTERYDNVLAIKDFSIYGNNFSLNKPINEFDLDYYGIVPYVNFQSSDYFYTPYTSSLIVEDGFTLLFAGQFNKNNTDCTLLAQSNDATQLYNWSVIKTSQNSIEVKIYTDKDNYITFSTGSDIVPESVCAIAITVDLLNAQQNAIIYVNNIRVNVSKVVSGTFTSIASNSLDTCSYIYNSSSVRDKNIDAKLSFLSLIGTSVSSDILRAINLNTMAMVGKNIYGGN